MKIVLTCGHPGSGFEFVHGALVAAGLMPAKPSRQQALTPQEYHERLLLAHEAELGAIPAFARQLAPGKVWEELAVDLFLGNMGAEAWGWADARTLALLEFWKSFDAQVRFVLVYSAPEFAVAQALRAGTLAPSEVERGVASWISVNAEQFRFYGRAPDRCVLVNASAAIASPSRLVERVAEAFSLPLSLEGRDFKADGFDTLALAARFARGLTEKFDEANDLYNELESAADLDSAPAGAEDEALRGWREFERRMQEGARAQASLASAQASLASALSELARLRDEHDGQLAQERQEHDGRLAQERQEHDGRLAALQEKHESQLVQLQRAHGDLVARVRAEQVNLSQENELLLLQLQQSHEELEGYASKLRELESRKTPAASSTPQNEAFIDMRGEIDGDNWYYAEHDGRWAGPSDTSMLRVPVLRDGEYQLGVEVVDAKSAEILRGTQIALNGTALPTRFEGKGVAGLVRARFSTASIPRIARWELRFKFPNLISPAQHGSKDTRVLAVRVRSVQISRVG